MVPAPKLWVVLLDVRQAPVGELVRVTGIINESEEEEGDVEEVGFVGVLCPGDIITRELYMGEECVWGEK